MSGDWIKMRTDLYRDPKVSRMAESLLDPEGPFAQHVRRNLGRDMSVTRGAIRGATCGALIAVWGVARHRGRRDGDDLRIDHATLDVVDDIADLPGFGAAMLACGWLEEDAQGLVFPRFFAQHNVDPGDKRREQHRERQRRYRDAKRGATGGATRGATVTHREEKSRDINIKTLSLNNAPNAPAAPGEGGQGRYKLSLEDLRDTGRLHRWFLRQSRWKEPIVRSTDDAAFLRILSAAEHALDVGDDPVGVFWSNVRHDRFHHGSDGAEERARERLHRFRRSGTGNGSPIAANLARTLSMGGG